MLTGKEKFLYNNKVTELNVLDFWQWNYSDVYAMHANIAEYIVAKALGCKEPFNKSGWTLYDIAYKNLRIEVKETAFYHSWQTDEQAKSQKRTFGITKAYTSYKDKNSEYKRQNDIYVFCLNSGETRDDSNPLILEHWEFYVVPTKTIDDLCGDAKTIGLSRVKKMTQAVKYDELKKKVDSVIKDIR